MKRVTFMASAPTAARLGSSKGSAPMRWRKMPMGQQERMLKRPTNPKKSCMSTRDSERIWTLSRITYSA